MSTPLSHAGVRASEPRRRTAPRRSTAFLLSPLIVLAGALGCAAVTPSARTDAPAANTPTANVGAGVGTSGGDTGIGLHYESVLPWGVAFLVAFLAVTDKMLIWWDRYWSNKRSLARIKAGQED